MVWVTGGVPSQPVFVSGQKNGVWVRLENSDPFCHVYIQCIRRDTMSSHVSIVSRLVMY